jgi:hypothetical protein
MHDMMDTRNERTRPDSQGNLRLALPVMLCLLIAATAALGDELRIKGSTIPYTKLKVDRIENGRLYYVMEATGTEGSRPIGAIALIKLEDYPDLGRAEDAIAAAKPDYDAAVRSLRLVQGSARESWVRHWVDYRLTTVAADARQPRVAVEAYLRLAQADETNYLGEPPVAAVERASAADKTRILADLERSRRALRAGAALDGVDKLIEAAKSATTTNGNNGGESDEPPVAMSSVGGRYIPSDAIGKMLEDGDAKLALREIRKKLESPAASMSLLLYQQGLAQLMLAEEAPDAGTQDLMIMDAGLSFARVMVYFRHTIYAVPATVELGYVHENLGRYDIAERLYDQAASSAKGVPALRSLEQRIEQLKQGLQKRKRAATDDDN